MTQNTFSQFLIISNYKNTIKVFKHEMAMRVYPTKVGIPGRPEAKNGWESVKKLSIH